MMIMLICAWGVKAREEEGQPWCLLAHNQNPNHTLHLQSSTYIHLHMLPPTQNPHHTNSCTQYTFPQPKPKPYTLPTIQHTHTFTYVAPKPKTHTTPVPAHNTLAHNQNWNHTLTCAPAVANTKKLVHHSLLLSTIKTQAVHIATTWTCPIFTRTIQN